MTNFYDLDFISEYFMGVICFNGTGTATIFEAERPFDSTDLHKLPHKFTISKQMDVTCFSLDDLPRNVPDINEVKKSIFKQLNSLPKTSQKELLKEIKIQVNER